MMEKHVRVVAWLYIILGVLGVLAAAIVFVAVLGGGLISGDRDAIRITAIVAVAISGFLGLLSAPGILAGIGLLGFHPWARILALVLAILNLPGFPTGTLLGVYTLYALLDDESSRLFNRP
jgi:hypothetical protein